MSIFGGAPFAGAPFGGMPESVAVAAPFTLHIAKSPDRREDIYRLVAYPRRKSDGDEVEIRYLDREWIGTPFIQTRLLRALEFQGSISSGFAGLGGGVPQIGSIGILGDTLRDSEALDTDALGRDYTWDNALVYVYLGGPAFTYNQFGPIFVGRAIDLIRNRTGVEIIIQDPSLRLDVPIQTNVYTGAGGTNGDERLANVPKPRCVGIRRRIEPELIDRVNRIYQWNDGDTLSTGIIGNGVFERGHAGFIRDADTFNVHAGTAPIAAHYRVSPTQGKFQLGAPAAGSISIDAYGDVRFGLSTADNVNGLCRAFAGFIDGDFDLPSFADLNADMPATIGWYTKGAAPTVGSVIDQLLGVGSPVGIPLGFKTWTRLGQLRVGIHKFRTPSRVIRGRQIADTRRDRTQAAFWRWQIGYQQCGQTLTDDVTSVVVGITDAERDFVASEFRRDAVFEDPAVRDAHGAPNSSQVDTLMDDAAAAQAEANRAGALTSVDRDFNLTDVYEHQWLIREGDTVAVSPDVADYGWDIEPGDYIVLGLGESTTTGRTGLQVWG